ncbi:MAG TPA: ABC transporter ATP-binding protein [Microscillaceae bacterium]|jgi:putative ABC transport system ATP-binding protein|nr:ABC transporter ATP-binding protein [Microscillaceae bacterium]
MIRLEQVSKTFNAGTPSEVKALQNIQLNIAPQTYLVLLGANGSGKSTLLNAIAGSFRVDKGEIWIDNQDVTSLKDFQRSPWIARIFQNPLSGTAPDLSVIDNFRLAALRTRPKGLRIGVNAAFKAQVKEKIALLGMGLENKIEQAMGTLSGGQRQALTLMMAVMDETKILLMDEPTAALDPRSAETLMQKADEIIRTFQLTAILVTHHLKDAHRFGNRVIQMEQGQVLRDLDATAKSALHLSDLFGWFE